jgi:hypothetical protein
MIPMGDINLLEEIRLNNETGFVGRHQPERTRVRRVYSAKIDGRNSGVTVAVYQGKGAEEVLYATAYPAELGIRPLRYYKPMQYEILGSGTCTMLDDL